MTDNVLQLSVERSIDRTKFRDDDIAILNSFGSKYYIKEDLRKAE